MTLLETHGWLRQHYPDKYTTVGYELHEFPNGKQETECRVYIDGMKGFYASTFNKAINQLNEFVSGVKQKPVQKMFDDVPQIEEGEG